MGASETEKAQEKKPRYPWYIIFILGNEFCERFTYYGMKTVLTLYFSRVLLFSEDDTTFYYHLFNFLCYFLPILGAWLADSLIGKFRTILWLSLVYILGLAVLTISAIPPLHVHVIASAMSGLLLIAIGTGGIKPCVSTYGADQFKPGQEHHRERFFAYFYFSINAGSLISTFVTPILRSDVHCFGDKTCYSLAFGVPALLMAVALTLFLLGRPFYTDTPVHGSIISRVVFCICHAIRKNIRGHKARNDLPRDSVASNIPIIRKDEISKSPVKKMKSYWTRSRSPVSTTHWLDCAEDKYDKEFIGDVKQLLKVLLMFVPIPMFWALFDQQGSRWTLQASKMDGRLSETYYFQPDQVQILNPVLILILIPFFETCVYPILHKFNIPFRLLARMVFGMVLAGVAFVIAGFLQIAVDKTLPSPPAAGMAEVTLFNADRCNLTLSAHFLPNNTDYAISPYEELRLAPFPTGVNASVPMKVQATNCASLSGSFDLPLTLSGGKAHAIVIVRHEGRLVVKDMEMAKEKPGEDANALVTFLIPFSLNSSGGNGSIILIDPSIAAGKEGRESMISFNTSNIKDGVVRVSGSAAVGPFDLYVTNGIAPNDRILMGGRKISFPNGGVYLVILQEDLGDGFQFQRYTLVEPNTINIFWQFPQYFVITVAEVFLSVSGLTFAYSEAPESMRSVMQAAWLLTSAFGSIIVMIFSGGHLIKSQAVEFFVFAGLIGIFAIIFAVMSHFYTYKEPSGTAVEMVDTSSSSSDDSHGKKKDNNSDDLAQAEADETQFKK